MSVIPDPRRSVDRARGYPLAWRSHEKRSCAPPSFWAWTDAWGVYDSDPSSDSGEWEDKGGVNKVGEEEEEDEDESKPYGI